MSAWLISVLERLPPAGRRLVVAALALLLVAAAITALTLDARRRGSARTSPPAAPPGLRAGPPRPVPPRGREPVSIAGLDRAAAAARRFVRSYLAFAYGRAAAASVRDWAPELRAQLIHQRAALTPAERRERPQAMSLHMVGTMPGFVVATATVADGGVAGYRLRFALQRRGGRWLVSDVRPG